MLCVHLGLHVMVFCANAGACVRAMGIVARTMQFEMHTGSPTVFLKQVETVRIWPQVICDEASQHSGMILIQSYEYLYSSLNAHKMYHFRVNCLPEMLHHR